MTISIPLWLLLPVLITVALLIYGVWLDLLGDLTFTLCAAIYCVCAWLGILYGRFEPWLVLPVLGTAGLAWLFYREKEDAEDRKFIALIFLITWAPVLYGRLTS